MPSDRMLKKYELKAAKELCLRRDGAGCNRCPKYKRIDQALSSLVLDHRDNNARNNPKSGSNWQLLCRAHNHLKNPRGKGKFHPSHGLTIESLHRTQPQSREMEKSERCEPVFVEWLREKLEIDGQVHIDDARNSGAYIADCSQKTIDRYINKYASDAGEFILDRETKMIRFKTYTPEPEEEEEKLPDDSVGSS